VSDRPPLWSILGTFVGATLFIGATLVYVPYLMARWHLSPPLFGWEPMRWIGMALMLLAAPVILDFLVRFVVHGHGTPVPIAPPTRLVVRGSFRYVRNPAYLAAVVGLVGQGLWFGSASVLIYALVMWVAFHLFVIGYEEPTLRASFGSEYEAYCRAVPRWLPRGRVR